VKIPQIDVKNGEDLDVAVTRQIVKILEEFGELRDVVVNRDMITNSKQKIIDEGNDLKTTVDTLFYLLGYTKEDLQAHRELHRQKLELREFNGKIKIDEWIEV